MHETGLGWFMGWEHIWYVGAGWRKRLVVMLLAGHAGLWSSALSRAATPVLGTWCRTGWSGTCVPWADQAIKAWVPEPKHEGSTGRAVLSAQCLKQQPHSTRSSGDPALTQREVCCARLGCHRERTHHPALLEGCHSLHTPPRKSLPVHLTRKVPTPYCWALEGM